MEIEKIKDEKKVLEKDLRDFIVRELGDFSIRTGIQVKSVNVSFMKIQSVGEAQSAFFLKDVSCEIDL